MGIESCDGAKRPSGSYNKVNFLIINFKKHNINKFFLLFAEKIPQNMASRTKQTEEEEV